MKRKTKSLKINPKIWKRIKQHCVNKEISISKYIEDLAKKDLNIKERIK